MSQRPREYRGSFASVGSDDRIHTVEARLKPTGELDLFLGDGRKLMRVMKGIYQTINGEGPFLRLRTDHPDAP